MDWVYPLIILLVIPAGALLWWFNRQSVRSLSPARAKLLLVVRTLLVLLVLLAIAGPALQKLTDRQAVIFVLDHSQSQGKKGVEETYQRMEQLAASLPASTYIGVVSAGDETVVRQSPTSEWDSLEPDFELIQKEGRQSDLATRSR